MDVSNSAHPLLRPRLQVQGYACSACDIEHRSCHTQAAVRHTSSFQGDAHQSEETSASSSLSSIMYAEHHDDGRASEEATHPVTTTCSSQDFNSATWSARESSSTHESGQKHEHVSISSPCSDAPDSLTEDIIKKVYHAAWTRLCQDVGPTAAAVLNKHRKLAGNRRQQDAPDGHHAQQQALPSKEISAASSIDSSSTKPPACTDRLFSSSQQQGRRHVPLLKLQQATSSAPSAPDATSDAEQSCDDHDDAGGKAASASSCHPMLPVTAVLCSPGGTRQWCRWVDGASSSQEHLPPGYLSPRGWTQVEAAAAAIAAAGCGSAAGSPRASASPRARSQAVTSRAATPAGFPLLSSIPAAPSLASLQPVSSITSTQQAGMPEHAGLWSRPDASIMRHAGLLPPAPASEAWRRRKTWDAVSITAPQAFPLRPEVQSLASQVNSRKPRQLYRSSTMPVQHPSSRPAPAQTTMLLQPSQPQQVRPWFSPAAQSNDTLYSIKAFRRPAQQQQQQQWSDQRMQQRVGQHHSQQRLRGLTEQRKRSTGGSGAAVMQLQQPAAGKASSSSADQEGSITLLLPGIQTRLPAIAKKGSQV